MSKIPPLLLLLLVTILVSVSPAQDLVISGTVRGKRSGMPIVGAGVRIAGGSGMEFNVLTDQSGNWSVTVHPASVPAGSEQPERFSVFQNYPNPFNPSTRIPFSVRASGRVKIAIYTLLGQELDARVFDVFPGEYSVDWRSKGATGVLFYSLTMEGVRITRRMIQLDGGGTGGLGGLSRISPAAGLPPRGKPLENQYRIVASDITCEPESTSIDVPAITHADLLLSTIHDRAFVIDLHNDVLEKVTSSGYDLATRHTFNHTDIPRMRDGGLDAQMFSVYIDPQDSSVAYAKAGQFLDAFIAQEAASPLDLGTAVNTGDITALNASGKIAGTLLLEGGYAIQNDIGKLKALYSRGIRCMTITWNASTSWAVAAADSRSSSVGLSEFGKQVIRTMDSLGMIIDVAHTGIKTIEDILTITKNPIIDSHAGVRALRDHYRNLTDNQIRAIAARGGVIGVVFYPTFLSSTGNATIATVIQHMDYIKNLVGVDYISLGSDFDGIEKTPVGLEDVSHFPALTEALLRHGYSRAEVRKILGENFLRVFQTVCQ